MKGGHAAHLAVEAGRCQRRLEVCLALLVAHAVEVLHAALDQLGGGQLGQGGPLLGLLAREDGVDARAGVGRPAGERRGNRDLAVERERLLALAGPLERLGEAVASLGQPDALGTVGQVLLIVVSGGDPVAARPQEVADQELGVGADDGGGRHLLGVRHRLARLAGRVIRARRLVVDPVGQDRQTGERLGESGGGGGPLPQVVVAQRDQEGEPRPARRVLLLLEDGGEALARLPPVLEGEAGRRLSGRAGREVGSRHRLGELDGAGLGRRGRFGGGGAVGGGGGGPRGRIATTGAIRRTAGGRSEQDGEAQPGHPL